MVRYDNNEFMGNTWRCDGVGCWVYVFVMTIIRILILYSIPHHNIYAKKASTKCSMILSSSYRHTLITSPPFPLAFY